MTTIRKLPDDDDQLIHASEAGSYLGLATQTLARWRHEKIGPKYLKLGRRVYYRAGDLRVWIKSRVRETAASMPGRWS